MGTDEPGATHGGFTNSTLVCLEDMKRIAKWPGGTSWLQPLRCNGFRGGWHSLCEWLEDRARDLDDKNSKSKGGAQPYAGWPPMGMGIAVVVEEPASHTGRPT